MNNYTSFSLNGAWKMNYSEDRYTSDVAPEFKGFMIEDAVPAYWEDMTAKFAKKEFYSKLRINPEYGIWEYPITNYCPDTALPNIKGNFFYSRTFLCEGVCAPTVLHFGGVCNAVSAWINGTYLGRHEGYSVSFDMPIPDGLLADGENTVVLSVSNDALEGFDGNLITGLSSRAMCRYSGGIWGDVELRVYTGELRDVAVIISEDCKSATVSVDAVGEFEHEWSVTDGEKILKQGRGSGSFTFDTEGLEYWTPETPKLYNLRVWNGECGIERKFGVRRLSVDGVHFRLNGTPCYLRGVCEHFYYPETVNACRDIAFYRNVIKQFKLLGFNYIRFHTYVPTEEYMQAADELGILMHIESPSYTTLEEWREIVRACRRHTSTVIYCCGNELQMYDRFMDHLRLCADEVHGNTDSLFSPMSALRGLEYAFGNEPELADEVVKTPAPHNPRRFAKADEFCDLYNSYTSGHHSYFSMACDVKKVDSWSTIYNKPRLSHEICIDGTYTDLSLKDRYKGSRAAKTGMLESIEKHLADKGLLSRAPLYFRNSCEWQRRVRKYCFEAVRRGENIAGYDFLGPIDTHWHTFGYDVGMMNEFYELKPTESIRNVRMYNSDTVLLTDLGRKSNFASGDTLSCAISASCFGYSELKDATLCVRLEICGVGVERRKMDFASIEGGKTSKLCDFSVVLPEVDSPAEMRLYVSLDSDRNFAENEWELYLYPTVGEIDAGDALVAGGISESDLVAAMEAGKRVAVFGATPFQNSSMSFRIALAGRCEGNLATVISDHPIFRDLPHGGFCSWQFESLMEGGRAIILECDGLPYKPIVEVASTHKNALKLAAMFEYRMGSGRFLVCSFSFKDDDPAARWLKKRIIDYVNSDEFDPEIELDRTTLGNLIHGKVEKSAANTNFAFNPNDRASASSKK